MKPVTIKTDGDTSLSVQTVTPIVNAGKIKRICPKQLCLLIEGETYTDKAQPFCQPVFLDREGVEQLIEELQDFINIPF
ncbi:MAG: hypothetical protein LBG15_09330 [Dysgonamonadaceae bacterium]|jgi:hypothetical protein|nr:hypothetical protein [Dysgonamonadaceae bacterium]